MNPNVERPEAMYSRRAEGRMLIPTPCLQCKFVEPQCWQDWFKLILNSCHLKRWPRLDLFIIFISVPCSQCGREVVQHLTWPVIQLPIIVIALVFEMVNDVCGRIVMEIYDRNSQLNHCSAKRIRWIFNNCVSDAPHPAGKQYAIQYRCGVVGPV